MKQRWQPRWNRRQFNAALVGVAAGTVLAPAWVRGQDLNSKLNIAIIGAGGRGGSNTNGLQKPEHRGAVRRGRESLGTGRQQVSRRA